MSSCLILYFSEGSNLTPAHHFPDFRFKTYAPVAFRYFRELFGIRPDDYLVRFYFYCVAEWIKKDSYHLDARHSLKYMVQDEKRNAQWWLLCC